MPSFEQLIADGQRADFAGWDFSYLKGRWSETDVSWNYTAIVRSRLQQATALLDMGTGGGEFLASLAPLPPFTAATEAYAPNVPIARARLAPLGVQVAQIEADDHLPFAAESFDLIINRHESYDVREVFRILKPGGTFITQQVGGRNDIELNEWLGAHPPAYADWSLSVAVDALASAGFESQEAAEEFPVTTFFDIGAVVYYLRAIPWQIADFSVERYRPQLRQLHGRICAAGSLPVKSHRFFLEARRGR